MSSKEEISRIDSALILAGTIEETIQRSGLKSVRDSINYFEQLYNKILSNEITLENYDEIDKLNSLRIIYNAFHAIKGLTNANSQGFFKNPTKLEEHLKTIREEGNKFSQNIADNEAFTLPPAA